MAVCEDGSVANILLSVVFLDPQISNIIVK